MDPSLLAKAFSYLGVNNFHFHVVSRVACLSGGAGEDREKKIKTETKPNKKQKLFLNLGIHLV